MKKGAELTHWRPFDAMLSYYEAYEPKVLMELQDEGLLGDKTKNLNKKAINDNIKKEGGENNETEEFHCTY